MIIFITDSSADHFLSYLVYKMLLFTVSDVFKLFVLSV